ncbi:methyltransferase [Nocardia sp. NPDC006982]|uniref:methyltransferase n=1 Tax=Nocardia sp. NPDC006982 TaxID=3364307 RepID=UPI0036B44A9B
MSNEGGAAPAAVRDIMHSAFLARALYVLVQLEIPDLLAAAGPLSRAELTDRLLVQPGPLQQLLRAGASTGLLSAEDSHGVTRYSLTEAGTWLTQDHPSATRDLITCFEGPIWRDSVTALPERITCGRTGPEIAHGAPLFELLKADRDAGASFDRLMTAQHGNEPAAVVSAVDLGWADWAVDVGGGTGALLTQMLSRYPRLAGTLLDQPAVIDRAREFLAHSDVSDRCTTVAGDFFHHVPPGADVYVLSHILHDWDDDDCLMILQACAAAMAQRSRLLIVEAILPDDDGAPHPARMLDLVMLAVLAGRERTLSEYRRLLDGAGLSLQQVLSTDAAISVLECVITPREGLDNARTGRRSDR